MWKFGMCKNYCHLHVFVDSYTLQLLLCPSIWKKRLLCSWLAYHVYKDNFVMLLLVKYIPGKTFQLKGLLRSGSVVQSLYWGDGRIWNRKVLLWINFRGCHSILKINLSMQNISLNRGWVQLAKFGSVKISGNTVVHVSSFNFYYKVKSLLFLCTHRHLSAPWPMLNPFANPPRCGPKQDLKS